MQHIKRHLLEKAGAFFSIITFQDQDTSINCLGQMESNYNSIRTWADDDKPREKLEVKGSEALSNAEIVAILINSGSREESAVDLAKRILQSVDNNLVELGKMSINDLIKFKGIGKAKAISIVAALQLGKRYRASGATKRQSVVCSSTAFDIFQEYISEEHYEQFYVMYLDHALKQLRVEQISKGGFASTTIDPKVIFSRALELKASAIMLCHNHPSGSLEPSSQDILLTRNLKDAGKMLQINVIEHIIIANNSYYSFVDENKM